MLCRQHAASAGCRISVSLNKTELNESSSTCASSACVHSCAWHLRRQQDGPNNGHDMWTGRLVLTQVHGGDGSKHAHLQGMVQAGGVVASVFHARFALFEVLQRLHGGRPTEALLLGCLLLGAALGCAPVALLQYSQAQGAWRALVLTAALGMLLVMLRPPLPTKVCPCPDGRLRPPLAGRACNLLG